MSNRQDIIKTLNHIRNQDKQGHAIDWNTAMRAIIDLLIDDEDSWTFDPDWSEGKSIKIPPVSETTLKNYERAAPIIKNCKCASVHPTIGLDYEAEYKKAMKIIKNLRAELRITHPFIGDTRALIDGIPVEDYIEQYETMKAEIEELKKNRDYYYHQHKSVVSSLANFKDKYKCLEAENNMIKADYERLGDSFKNRDQLVSKLQLKLALARQYYKDFGGVLNDVD